MNNARIRFNVPKDAAFTQGHKAIQELRKALDISSPSLAFIEAMKRLREGESMQCTIYAPPWYAARDPLDAWPSKSMERQARLLRRAIRQRQPAIIKLFWRYMGVDDGAFNVEIARAQIIVKQCNSISSKPIGEAMLEGLTNSFRAMTRKS